MAKRTKGTKGTNVTRRTKRTWDVSLKVVNNIGPNPGTLTRLLTVRKIEQIIRDAVNEWRDLKAVNVIAIDQKQLE